MQRQVWPRIASGGDMPVVCDQHSTSIIMYRRLNLSRLFRCAQVRKAGDAPQACQCDSPRLAAAAAVHALTASPSRRDCRHAPSWLCWGQISGLQADRSSSAL